MAKIYIQKITSCKECPYFFELAYFFECAAARKTLGKLLDDYSGVPSWCPLPEYEKGENE